MEKSIIDGNSQSMEVETLIVHLKYVYIDSDIGVNKCNSSNDRGILYKFLMLSCK